MAKEPTKGQKILMKKLKASQAKGMGERARKKITKDSGTLTSRMESAKKSAKTKGGPLTIRRETLPAVRKENVPAKRDGGSRAIVKRESGQMVVRDGKSNLPVRADGGSSGAGGVIRKMLPGAFRAVGGPAVMLASMTTPTGDGQEAKPPKYGMSLKEKSEREGGSVLKKASAPMSNKDAFEQYSWMGNRADDPISQPRDRGKRSYTYPVGPFKPKTGEPKSKAKAPIPKARPVKGGAAEDRKSFAGKAKAAPKPSFRGNWVGAAPTAMQARGGARIKRRSLRDLIRGER